MTYRVIIITSHLIIVLLALYGSRSAAAQGQEAWAVAPECEIAREEIPLDEKYLRGRNMVSSEEELSLIEHYQYTLTLEGKSSPVPLAKLYRFPDRAYQSGFRPYGLDRRSFKLAALSPSIVHASWATCPQGSGGYTMGSHLLIQKCDAEWEVIFRDSHLAHSDGGVYDQSDGALSIYWEPETQRLILKHTHTRRYIGNYDTTGLSYPLSRIVEKDMPDTIVGIVNHTSIKEWECEIGEGSLVCGMGTHSIDLGDYVHPLRDVARSLLPWSMREKNSRVPQEEIDSAFEEEITNLRQLNPKLAGRDVCSGIILLENQIQPHVPDTTHYYLQPK